MREQVREHREQRTRESVQVRVSESVKVSESFTHWEVALGEGNANNGTVKLSADVTCPTTGQLIFKDLESFRGGMTPAVNQAPRPADQGEQGPGGD